MFRFMRDVEPEDPMFLMDPFAIHRQHMSRMLSGGFGYSPFLSITDGNMPATRPASRRMQAGAVSPFGMLGMSGGFMDMFGMMNDMIGNMEHMAAGGNCQTFSSSTVISYSNTGDGAPKVYQETSEMRSAPGGIRETRRTVRDSDSGLEQMSIGHHIRDRAHILLANLVLSQHCTSQPSPRAKNVIPPPPGTRGLSLESVSEGGDDPAQARKIIKQPGASLARREGGSDLETMPDPFDDCFSEEAPNTTKHKLSSFLFSYLSVQNRRKTTRSLSCNSVPMSAQKSLPADASLKNGGSFRARIFSGFPEQMMMMKKGAFKKLIKFYSVPSFPECSSQCARQLPCCPLEAMV